MIAFIESAVEPGAAVHTDGWQAYWTVPDHGYEHDRAIMRGQHDPAHVLMPGVHRVASRRHSRRRGLLFYRLLEQAVITDPITYRSLIVNPRPGRPRPTLPIRSPPQPAIERPWRTST